MDTNLLSINVLFGVIVLYTYFKYLGDSLKIGVKVDELWGNIKGNYRNVYYISMVISALSYLYLCYYLICLDKKIHNNKNIIYIGTILFFIGASLWAPFVYNHFKNNLNKIFIYLSLCLTTCGIILLFIHIMNNGNLFSKICISLFLFHVLILDNLIWSIKFQKI